MPVISRHDGEQFVVYPYREMLTYKKSSLLKREIRLLETTHGNNACFFVRPDGDIEAVFSRDNGYLLGEAIKDFYPKSEDLIYCEAQDDGKNALLVVVRGGSVFLDAQVPLENLVDEFASLVAGRSYFDIVIYGDVPLSEQPEEGKFSFDAAFVKSFSQSDQSIFNQIQTSEKYRLAPVEEAMTRQAIGRKSMTGYLILGLIIFVGFMVYWQFMTQPKRVQKPTGVQQIQTQDPLAVYENMLKSPDPVLILAALSKDISFVYQIPGWNPSQINFNGKDTVVTLKKGSGTPAMLLAWSKLNNVVLDMKGTEAKVHLTTKFKTRPSPKTIHLAEVMLSAVYGRVPEVLVNSTLTQGRTKNYGKFEAIPVSISFADVTSSNLVLLGKVLANLPIVINKYSVTLNNGLLSGTINLTALGN